MSEGIIGSTVEEGKRHPYLVVGGCIAIVVLLWFVSSRKSTGTQASNFTFSYGPSDASIKAGTELAIAQQADQTQVSLAQIQATATGSALSSYFDYLTGATTSNNATTLAAARINADTTTAVAGINAQTAQVQANDAYAASVSHDNAAIQGYAYNLQVVNSNNSLAYNALQAQNYQAGLASYTSTFNAAQAANAAYNHDQAQIAIAGYR